MYCYCRTQRLLNTQPVFLTVDQAIQIMNDIHTFLFQYIVLMGNNICDS